MKDLYLYLLLGVFLYFSFTRVLERFNNNNVKQENFDPSLVPVSSIVTLAKVAQKLVNGNGTLTNPGNLQIGASTSTPGNLTVTGNSSVNGTSTLTGNTTVGGTLGVTGATTMSTLGVTGATTVGGTLGVTGATTMSSTLDVTGATTLKSSLGVTSNTTVGGTLEATGATTLKSTLGVTGATTLGTTTVGGTGLTVTAGGASVTGGLTVATGGLIVNNNSTLKGDIYLGSGGQSVSKQIKGIYDRMHNYILTQHGYPADFVSKFNNGTIKNYTTCVDHLHGPHGHGWWADNRGKMCGYLFPISYSPGDTADTRFTNY